MKGSSIFSRTLVVVMLLAFPALARNVETVAGSSGGHSLNKALAANGPVNAAITINNYLIFVDRNSESPLVSGAGLAADYPKGTGGMIYKEGLVWGARVRDGSTPIIRVNGSTYATGLKAGRVLYTAGKVSGSEDRASRHVWRVRPDYLTADLTADYAYSNSVSLTAVTAADTLEIRAQYTYDWENWPGDEGAPYDDVDGDGSYDPAIDIPGWPGADQTLWLVANDLPYIDPESGDTIQVSLLSYGSPAIGMELQITMWGYAFAADHPLGNVVFKRARVIYTGLAGGPSDAKLDSVYFTQWSDPDLGTYTDDYVGCDIELSFGYVYNGSATDGTFLGDFGIPVPSGGYDFLQGPIVGGDTLGMTSFGYFGAGSSISDPTMGDYDLGTLEWWNLMEGFLPQPGYPNQTPWTDPTTGQTTIFPLSGDPVTGTGWIDGIILPPGDRRLLLNSGPFSMALGDTQDVVLACVAGIGLDNISSVTVAKFHDTFGQYAYDNDFILPSPPTTPLVDVKGFDGEIILNWGNSSAAVAATEDLISLGFVFEGYNVYQLPEESSIREDWVKVATFDVINLIQTIFDKGVDPKSGFILDQAKQAGTNSGIQRYYRATRDEVRDRPITNDNPLFFAVTAYSYLTDNADSPFKTLESSPALVSVIPQQFFGGEDIPTATTASNLADHSVGTAGGAVTVNVVNPADLTGDSYEVYFDQQHYYMDFDGQWKTTNYPDSVGKALGKGMDLAGTTVSAIAYTSPTAGTRDLKFILDLQSPDYDYSDGMSLTFPPGITINSAETTEGGYHVITPVIDEIANTVTWGAADTTGDGEFSGGEVFTVNVVTPALPLDVDYIVWDDGWAVSYGAPYDTLGDGVVHAVGTLTISTEAYAFKTEKHWNLENTTSGSILLEDQANIDGVDLYTGELYGPTNIPIFDGFQVNVSVGYAAPLDILSVDLSAAAGSYDITTFTYFGYPTGWAVDSYSAYGAGGGTVDVNILQRDLELRFTGEYDTDGVSIKDGTGSIATYFGASLYDMADHPLNPDGSTNPFTIRIPFELWDTEYDNGDGTMGRQVTLVVWDRHGEPDGTEQDFYPTWNPTGRMYVWALDKAYTEDVLDPDGADAPLLSWNIVFLESDWVTGDVVHINFANPIQLGVDTWTFSTDAPTSGDDELADETFDKVNVFPNPYYGFHPLEDKRAEKWVKFNHLPEKVTVRIFTLGGVMVRVLNKSDNTQYLEWDLKNQGGFPVASGIYIALVDATDLGKTKILKLAIVQEEQILKRY